VFYTDSSDHFNLLTAFKPYEKQCTAEENPFLQPEVGYGEGGTKRMCSPPNPKESRVTPSVFTL